MAKPIIRGSLQPVQQRVRITFDPQQGVTRTTEFESAGDNCGGLASSFEQAGIAYDLTTNLVKSRLVATQSRNGYIEEQAVERWELMTNQNQLDIREHPNSTAMPQAHLAAVMRDVKKHEAGKTVDVSGYTVSQDALFKLMTRGVTHYPVWQWVVRYTANVSNSYQLFTDANSGVGEIYSTSELGLPVGRIRSTVQAIEAPAADVYTTWGWLKMGVNEVTSARSRVDVSAEFQLGSWANYIYL